MPDEQPSANSSPAGPTPNVPPASNPADSDTGTPSHNRVESVHADHASVTMAGKVNQFVFQVGAYKGMGGKGRGWPIAGYKRKNIKLDQALHADPSGGALAEHDQADAADQTQKKVPETLDEISIWYRGLTDIEKCFVQAVAVLSGAPDHEIRRATNELYRPIQETEEKRLQLANRLAIRSGDESSLPVAAPSILLDTQFLTRTYTTIRKFDRARRLFWQDTQANGFSQFSVLVLRVIEQEVPLGGQPGQVGRDLLEHLEQLPKKLGGESSWRVPYALGSLWADADEIRLQRMADAWARDRTSDDFWGWRVGHLLEGAFAVEYNLAGSKVYQRSQSVVLSLLNEWVEDVHGSAVDPVCVRLGCAAAMTYRLLGKQHLQIALKGLDDLLHFMLPDDENEAFLSEDVFIACVASYAALASYGYTRQVVAHLAEIAEHLAYQRQDIKFRGHRRDVRERLLQRLITLVAIINTFILLVSRSSGLLQEDATAPYAIPQTLEERPEIPGEQGVDTLLSGVIANGEAAWRKHISTILSTIFVEDSVGQALSTDNVELALLILYEWAEEVLALRGPGALKVRRAYLDFVVAVVRQAEQWGQHLRKNGYNARSILLPTLTIIKRWQEDSKQPPQPLEAFAEDVLRQLQPH